MNHYDIRKYLEGKSTEKESEQLEEWLTNQENDSKSRQLLGDIWATTDINLIGSIADFSLMLKQVHQKINSNKRSTIGQKSNFRYKFYRVFSKAAAILIIPLLLSSIYFYYKQEHISIQRESICEISTKPGTRTKLELSDGTQVWLNDGTTFRYPEQFTGSKREVFVDGEAYFEVRSNAKHPFVVNNPMMKTVVTGTHFNVNAYVEDHFFEVTLMEGKVSLGKDNQTIAMVPGEQVQFDALLNKIVRKNVNSENAAAWINGQLVFKNEKLGTAIKKLGRWYNVDIVVSNNEINEYLLTGTIRDEKLTQTLDMISLALPVKFGVQHEISGPPKIKKTIYVMNK